MPPKCVPVHLVMGWIFVPVIPEAIPRVFMPAGTEEAGSCVTRHQNPASLSAFCNRTMSPVKRYKSMTVLSVSEMVKAYIPGSVVWVSLILKLIIRTPSFPSRHNIPSGRISCRWLVLDKERVFYGTAHNIRYSHLPIRCTLRYRPPC